MNNYIRLLLVSLLLWGNLIYKTNAQTLTLSPQRCAPAQDSFVSTIDSIMIAVDISDDFWTLNNVQPEDIGVSAQTSKKKPIRIYKEDEGKLILVDSITVSAAKTSKLFHVGSDSLKLPLNTTLTLEAGKAYKVQIPSKCVLLASTSKYYSTPVLEESYYNFYGPKPSTDEIQLLSSFPSSNEQLNQLDSAKFSFNINVSILENAKAQLYDGDELIKEAILVVDNTDKTKVIADFKNELLYNTHKYTLVVPENSIFPEGENENSFKKITLSYTGKSFRYFGYGAIKPVANSVQSILASVEISVDFPDGIDFVYSTAQATYPISLYKGIDETGTLIGTYDFEKGSVTGTRTIKGLINEKLEPNETYALVLPENLILPYVAYASPAKLNEEYRSKAATFIYYGANTASKWSIKDNDQLEKLGLVSLMTGGEAMVNEGAKMALYCGEDSVTSADINASGTFCYADFGDLVLEQDSVYSLVIPDSAIVNMPKTTQKFKGITKPAEYATVSYKSNGITVASEQVLKGSAVKVDIAMPDSIHLDSLMLNGEKVALADSAYTIDSLAADAEIEAALTYIPTPAPQTVFYNVDYKVLSIANDSTMQITTVASKVAEDSVFTFKAPELDDNWSVEASAGEMSEDSIYSVVVVKDTSVVVTCKFVGEVTYVDESTSGVFILDKQEVKISTTQGKIVVEGAKADDTINLYGLNGAKLGQWVVKQDKQTIDVNSGVYLVVVKGDAGKAAAKVSVK